MKRDTEVVAILAATLMAFVLLERLLTISGDPVIAVAVCGVWEVALLAVIVAMRRR